MTKNPNAESKNNKKDNYNGMQRESNQKKSQYLKIQNKAVGSSPHEIVIKMFP